MDHSTKNCTFGIISTNNFLFSNFFIEATRVRVAQNLAVLWACSVVHLPLPAISQFLYIVSWIEKSVVQSVTFLLMILQHEVKLLKELELLLNLLPSLRNPPVLSKILLFRLLFPHCLRKWTRYILVALVWGYKFVFEIVEYFVCLPMSMHTC